MDPISDSSTLPELRRYVEERLDDGVKCPCCDQRARRYKRKLSSDMARALVALYREHLLTGAGWVKLRDVLLRDGWHTGDYSYLRHWGLLEAKAKKRKDGNSAGLWRLTDSGRAFVRGEIHVLKYAHVFNGVVQTFSGPQVFLRDCIDDHFNLAELLQRAA